MRRRSRAESERDFNLTINTIPALVWSARIDGTADFLNQHYLDYVGLTTDQAQGWNWTAAVHPDDLNGLVAAWQTVLASGKAGEAEARLRRFDGQYRWFLFRANPLRDQSGNIVKWYGVNTDIEDRKRAEIELRTNEQRYRELFNSVPVALIEIDSQKRAEMLDDLHRQGVTDVEAYLDANPDFERRAIDASIIKEVNQQSVELFGARDADALIGASTARLLAINPGALRRGTVSQFRGEKLFQHELKLETLGRTIDVLLTVARPDVNRNFLALTDITKLKTAEERLQRLQAEFAHAARISMLGELAASIVHEVNQPLAALQTNSETALRWLDRQEPDVAKARDLIRRNVDDAHRARDIVVRIREMASGRLPAHTELSLHDVIHESIVFLRHELQSNGVSVVFDLTPTPPVVTGDRIQLQQVIVNLTVNAVSAMTQSAVASRTLLIRTGQPDAETLSCAFEDSGPGIDPGAFARLFDSFFTTKDAGMGMGLPVSRSIIEAHGGVIKADNNSQLGGARFSFELPVEGATAQ